MNQPDVGTMDLIAKVIADYCTTGLAEHAAFGMQLLGVHVRETRGVPAHIPTSSDSILMAAKAMGHWRMAVLSTGDGWDQAYSCDSLVSGWLLARFYLRNHTEKYSRQIAVARSTIAEIEEAVDPRDALAYIRKQPPLLWMGEPWNNGIWRGYYAQIGRLNHEPKE